MPIACARLNVEVVRDRLDDVLAVVEHALDRDVVDVGVLQAEHLRLLERAHAAVRREHEDATPCLPRIAYSAALPVSPEVAPRMLSVCAAARQLVLEQVAEQLHRHVLERQRRAVRQRLETKTPGSSACSGVIARRRRTPRRV